MKSFSQHLGAIAIAVVSVSTASLPAVAEQWVRVQTDKSGTVAYFDKSSVKRVGNDRDFWLYISSPRPFLSYKNQAIYNMGMQLSMNCSAKKVYQPHFIRYMGQDNQLIAEIEIPESLKKSVLVNPQGVKIMAKLVCPR